MFKKRAVKQQQVLKINQQNQQTNNHTSTQQKQNPRASALVEQGLQRQQPQKKVKPDIGKNVIASSTLERKQQNEAQLHKQFKSLNYSAGQQLSANSQLLNPNTTSQLLLQQQQAKKKYLQNVDVTQQIKQGKLDKSIYRGMNSYANYALTEDEIKNAGEKFRQRQGPSRVNSTIRNTCRFDYNFGLCKDWHDSGYCPFGDSCIYLHDRSNYKTGWEQERDFERAEKERWKRINNPELALKQEMQQSLKSIEKFKVNQICQKCTNTFKSPVQVDCGHIFCASCALKMNKCVTCKKTLSGIMNNAEKKMEKMKQIYEDLKAKILKENEQNRVKRKKYENISSQDVFAQ